MWGGQQLSVIQIVSSAGPPRNYADKGPFIPIKVGQRIHVVAQAPFFFANFGIGYAEPPMYDGDSAFRKISAGNDPAPGTSEWNYGETINIPKLYRPGIYDFECVSHVWSLDMTLTAVNPWGIDIDSGDAFAWFVKG